ncbi:MAG: tripartite tricarboxylate transporter substrate binding protein [Proteobacteria bacterium]|nr:tripartite tricarboxylate transporter substrate binding protein [Burkholderiales bacterium]
MHVERLLLASMLSAPGFAATQTLPPPSDYPTRVVRMIVPRAPGGLVDVVARVYAQSLSERLGQPVVIDNRPGGGGTIAGEAAARATPDGHTLFIATQDSQVLTPILRKQPPYDALRDFTPISLLFTTPLYLFVHPSVPAQSVQELVAIARARPGKLTYASLGVGSTQHLAAELFKSRMKLDILHVPYKSTAQALVEQQTGQVDINFTAGTSHFPFVNSGKLRVLGSTGLKRSALHPQLPTMIEAGVPGFDMEPWYGLAGPARLSARIVEHLNRVTGEILRSGPIRERFAADGLEPRPSTPKEFEARIRADLPLWTQTMRDAGFKAE